MTTDSLTSMPTPAKKKFPLLIVLFAIVVLGLGGVLYYATTLPHFLTVQVSAKSITPQHELWAKLRAIENIPQWQGDVRAVMPLKQSETGITHWRQIYSRYEFKGAILSESPPDSIAWEMVSENNSTKIQCSWFLAPLPPDSTQIQLQCTKTVAPLLQRFGLMDKQEFETSLQLLLQQLIQSK